MLEYIDNSVDYACFSDKANRNQERRAILIERETIPKKLIIIHQSVKAL